MDDDELIPAMAGGDDAANQKAGLGGAARSPAGRSTASPAGWRTRSRWLVHLGLLACAAAALGTLQLLHIRNAIHADVGLAFAGLVLVHLAQRRHRIAGMFARLWGFRRRVATELRLLASDAILAFVTVNVVISGILDWNRGSPTTPARPATTFRQVAHLLASVVLIVYLACYVSRRWRRLRRSTIR